MTCVYMLTILNLLLTCTANIFHAFSTWTILYIAMATTVASYIEMYYVAIKCNI